MSEKLTPTMLDGLRRMAKRLERMGCVMAEPNENTGRALLKRGLIEIADDRAAWPRYRLTDLGRTALTGGQDG